MVLTPGMTFEEMVAEAERVRNSEEFKNLPKNIHFEDEGDGVDCRDEIKDVTIEELERDLEDDDRDFWGGGGMAKWLGII